MARPLTRRVRKTIDRLDRSYSKTVGFDLGYYLKGGFWLSASQAVTFLKSFLLSILFANLLAKEAFGSYTFLISILGLLSVFSLPGLIYSIINAVAKGKEGTYLAALRTIMRWSVLGSACLLGFALYVRLFNKDFDILLLIFLALLYPFYAVGPLYNSFYSGRKDFRRRMSYTILIDILSFIAIASAVILTKDVFWVVIATVLSQAILQFSVSGILVPRTLKNKEISEADLAFGRKTSLSISYTTLIFALDAILVGLILGYEQLAIYSLVVLIPEQSKTLFKIFGQLLQPEIAGQRILRKDLFRKLRFLILISLVLVTLYALLAPVLFKTFYPAYAAYASLSILFSASFIGLPTILLSANLVRLSEHKRLNSINIISSTLLIVGTVAGALTLGLLGVILNRIAYRLITLALNLYHSNACTEK